MVDPQGPWFTIDGAFHVGDFLLLAGVAWRVLRVANRLMDVLKYFPPHRHSEGGSIEYPPGFEPGHSERLRTSPAGPK
ncbi:MAG TPA: hypothetical protein VLY23_18475 [Candidatus Acidoferrum sp.]|nr:hypothetical protein [Candidatus Acidoferrum sp.]